MLALRTDPLRFTAFGVPMEIVVPVRLRERATALLPPGSTALSGEDQLGTVAVAEQDGRLVIFAGGQAVGVTEDEELALGMVEARIRAHVALLAPEHIFVHAGVVALGERAIVLPGFTFTGKTTLTRALVEAGATYYSDEFAVVDAYGLVHPYPKPLSIRCADSVGRTIETPAAALGAETGVRPVPVGLIAITSYRSGAGLVPEALGSGAALLALLGHTLPARTRPRQAMATLKAAVSGARAWRSERGEAGEAARAIIAQLSGGV